MFGRHAFSALSKGGGRFYRSIWDTGNAVIEYRLPGALTLKDLGIKPGRFLVVSVEHLYQYSAGTTAGTKPNVTGETRLNQQFNDFNRAFHSSSSADNEAVDARESALLRKTSTIHRVHLGVYPECDTQLKGVRGFAKTVQVPQLLQKPMKLKLYMGSPGVIGEPYKSPPPPLPFLRRWFTKEGWRRKKQSFMGMVKTSYTIAKLRQKTKGYSQQRFYQEASDLYKQINLALAQGERTTLRHLVTDSVFSILKNELKHRENSAWAKLDWEMVGPVSKMRTLQGRLIGVDKNNHDNAFVQLTVRVTSKQKFAAYDKRGKLVAGDPEKELLVEEIWVFEKPLLLSEAKWRLCARLSS